jgi:S1-C subfamily serine protease
VVGERVRSWILGLALVLWGAGASALPLQELSATARGRVAHLSVRDDHGEEMSSGSGFVISSGGRLVTNFHVIDDAENIVAVFPDKREAKVTGVWAFDKDVDLAILQLEPGQYTPLALATEPAREGEDIVVIGSPLGLGNSISAGVVSAVRENGIEKTAHRDAQASWGLQFTAAAAPGSSGSPILRVDGEVVGVLVGHIGGMDGAHFGILVSRVQRLLGSAPEVVKPLAAATGARSTKTNLIISGVFFTGLALVWLAASHLHRFIQKRRAPVQR